MVIIGSSIGHTFAETRLKPHLGLGVDAASGNRNRNGQTLNTSNPLFPNGHCLAGYTGYPNLIHIKPAMRVHPTRAVNLRVAVASQWRESVADAVYAFPTIPIPKTTGRPGRYTGAYGELRADWKITPHYSPSLEAVHYAIGKSIRQAGGHNANFLAIDSGVHGEDGRARQLAVGNGWCTAKVADRLVVSVKGLCPKSEFISPQRGRMKVAQQFTAGKGERRVFSPRSGRLRDIRPDR